MVRARPKPEESMEGDDVARNKTAGDTAMACVATKEVSDTDVPKRKVGVTMSDDFVRRLIVVATIRGMRTGELIEEQLGPYMALWTFYEPPDAV